MACVLEQDSSVGYLLFLGEHGQRALSDHIQRIQHYCDILVELMLGLQCLVLDIQVEKCELVQHTRMR